MREDLLANLDAIEPTFANIELTPAFVRSCSTLYRNGGLPPSAAQRIATLCDATVDSTIDYNKLCSVAHSCLMLQHGSNLFTNSQSADDIMTSMGGGRDRSESSSSSSSHSASSAIAPAFFGFPPVIKSAYDKAIMRMKAHNHGSRHTDATIQLLRVSHDVYHHDTFTQLHSRSGSLGGGAQHRQHHIPFVFRPVGAEMQSLLPIKSKLQLESKLMRTGEARDILKVLRRLRFNRVDAGMVMGIMAECGLYDADVATECGNALHESMSLMSSEQIAHALFSFGVVNHRHTLVRQLGSRFDATANVTTEGMRRYALGLACLQFPVAQKRQVADWVFMHALRFPENDPRAPNASWYVDCLFALACLGIKSHKFSIMTARRTRKSLGTMSVHHKLRLLYALDYVKDEKPAANIAESWSKIRKTMDVITEVLKTNVQVQDGPIVAGALMACGYRDHPLVPKVDIHHTKLNPVQQILSAWTTAQRSTKEPRDRTVACSVMDGEHTQQHEDMSSGQKQMLSRDQALKLTEQIRPHHFSESTAGEDLTNVFRTLAFEVKFRVEQEDDQERFRSLCEVVETQLHQLSLEDAALVLRAMQHIGLLSDPRHTRCRDLLLEKFWSERFRMSADVQDTLFDTMEGLEQDHRVFDLTEFIASQRDVDTSDVSNKPPSSHPVDEY